MPALDPQIVADLEERLGRYLAKNGGCDKFEYLNSGGSAAVYKVWRGDITHAIKVFTPALFADEPGAQTKHRLSVQRRLVQHSCSTLLQTYRIEEAEGTAFVEMELVDWPQLAKTLHAVPDEAIVPLFGQLVEAVQFLEKQGMVHRDIKPENIHVSADFKHLKLLDLGVAREFDCKESDRPDGTDHGGRRPFLATAQYSSPEYLFRLDEPSTRLWHGLNFYQLGAVLHDLIRKEALFAYEISLGNRWLVARAVLTKTPGFTESERLRLPSLVALASRCLIKDLEMRLALVGWDDFILEGTTDPLTALRGRLSKGAPTPGSLAFDSAAARLEFDRGEFTSRLINQVRSELLHVCGTQLPITVRTSSPGAPNEAEFVVPIRSTATIRCRLSFAWRSGLYQRAAELRVGGQIIAGNSDNCETPAMVDNSIHLATIMESEAASSLLVSQEIARLIGIALDYIEAAGQNVGSLNGVDLQG